jgi:hypothetical protein
MNNESGCPHCLNETGFVFGTCTNCGFNYLSEQFERIEVNVDDLPYDIAYWLISRHARLTKGMFKK